MGGGVPLRCDLDSPAVSPPARSLGSVVTAAIVAALGFLIGLAGDAGHVASGTTRYEWDGVPTIWNSQIWFPFLVAGAVLAAAWSSDRAGVAAVRPRGRADVVTGAALVLGLYAVTALMR